VRLDLQPRYLALGARGRTASPFAWFDGLTKNGVHAQLRESIAVPRDRAPFAASRGGRPPARARAAQPAFRVDHLGVALEALGSTAARIRAQILGSPPEVRMTRSHTPQPPGRRPLA
jgi:hypothetical protein